MAAKLKKYPKKPKAGASLDTLKNYLAKCNEIDKENKAKKNAESERLKLKKVIQSKKQSK